MMDGCHFFYVLLTNTHDTIAYLCPQRGEIMAKERKVYISLPISHFDLEERRAYAEEIEKFLGNFYHEIVNPLKNGISQEEHWSVHMRRDIRLLTECDVIYMCRGWEMSKGCKLEHDVATSCGLSVIYESQEWNPRRIYRENQVRR